MFWNREIPCLSNQFRQRPVIADQVVRTAGKVGKLRAGHIDPQALIEGGEDVTEMNRPGMRLLTPACRRAENLPAAHTASRHQGAGNLRPVVAAAILVDPRCAAKLAPN